MAESRRFQEELSHRDERTESLRDFGQAGVFGGGEGGGRGGKGGGGGRLRIA